MCGDGDAQVVGGLLDAEAPDEFINNLILSVRSLIPVEQLCAEARPARSPSCDLPRSQFAGCIPADSEC